MTVSRRPGDTPLAYLLFPEWDIRAVIADVGVKGRQRRAKENKRIVLWVRRPLPLPRIECHHRTRKPPADPAHRRKIIMGQQGFVLGLLLLGAIDQFDCSFGFSDPTPPVFIVLPPMSINSTVVSSGRTGLVWS